MLSINNVIAFSISAIIITSLTLTFQPDTPSTYVNKDTPKVSYSISQESSIVAQLIWNNVLDGMPIEEQEIGIPAFIDGMQKAANSPAADYESHFGNIKNGTEYFHLHKLLNDNKELKKNRPIANFPYEKYHNL